MREREVVRSMYGIEPHSLASQPPHSPYTYVLYCTVYKKIFSRYITQYKLIQLEVQWSLYTAKVYSTIYYTLLPLMLVTDIITYSHSFAIINLSCDVSYLVCPK